ncbi:unnamed protein product [Urochloa humidicola]
MRRAERAGRSSWLKQCGGGGARGSSSPDWARGGEARAWRSPLLRPEARPLHLHVSLRPSPPRSGGDGRAAVGADGGRTSGRERWGEVRWFGGGATFSGCWGRGGARRVHIGRATRLLPVASTSRCATSRRLPRGAGRPRPDAAANKQLELQPVAHHPRLRLHDAVTRVLYSLFVGSPPVRQIATTGTNLGVATTGTNLGVR